MVRGERDVNVQMITETQITQIMPFWTLRAWHIPLSSPCRVGKRTKLNPIDLTVSKLNSDETFFMKPSCFSFFFLRDVILTAAYPG